LHFDTVQLTEIYLAGCYRITPQALLMLVALCPKLDCVLADGCDLLIKWYNYPDTSSSFDNGSLILSREQIIKRKDME
jgi:hypothetical protein